MGLPHDEGWAIPFDSPYYPPLPAHYRGVWFQHVFFEADPAAVSRFLPEPLEASPDGLCTAVGIKVPFSTSYGAFNEAALMLRCTFRGEAGWYISHVWHDGPAGIAEGREISSAANRQAIADRETVNAALDAVFADFDAILTPASPGPAHAMLP